MGRTRLPEPERRAQLLRAAATVALRDGLDGLTVRAVAAEAGVSHGLVIHYFGAKGGLQTALLDWLLGITLVPQVEGLAALPPAERAWAFVERQLAWLDAQPDVVELFFDYWARGTRDTAVRDRIRERMVTFRRAVEPVAADLIAADPDRFRETDPGTLATAIGDLVLGYVIQRVVNPSPHDRAALLSAIRALLALPAPDTERASA